METKQYIIRGGVDGRERLRLLSGIMGPSTRTLIAEAGIPAGAKCLDIGCGGGDVTRELAAVVGPAGRVLGIDRDVTVVDIAREESLQQGFENISFEVRDLAEWEPGEDFDVVYARFLLSHLQDPARLIAAMYRHIRPGGMICVEDVEFRGHFSEPECSALQRYVELYTRTAQSRGVDPNIGPRLPGLLLNAGFKDVQIRLFHPASLEGGIKDLTGITLETIADAVLTDGVTTREEFGQVLEELVTFSRNSQTVLGGPRVFQVWGYASRTS